MAAKIYKALNWVVMTHDRIEKLFEFVDIAQQLIHLLP